MCNNKNNDFTPYIKLCIKIVLGFVITVSFLSNNLAEAKSATPKWEKVSVVKILDNKKIAFKG